MANTIKGIAVAPGVSKNRRLYTRENIAKAYTRLAARLEDPAGAPVNMRTHHGAGDDSTRIAAQVHKVSLTSEGAIRYEATPVNTAAAADIKALTKPHPKTGKPSVAVSISGWWIGDPDNVEHDGDMVETGDDLEINAIDFTANPGVSAASATSETAAGARAVINESVEAEVLIVDETEQQTADQAARPATAADAMRAVHEAATKKAPYGDVTYADPGYQSDGKKRYPLDSEEHVRAAWSYINQADNAKAYSAKQLKAIKGRIKSAAGKYDIKVEDSWLYSGRELAESEIGEYYAYGYEVIDGTPAGTFCFNATNGPISVSISSYCIDPADLEVVTRAACAAIATALEGLDPDMDGDIDLPGAPGEETDHDDSGNESAADTQAAPVAETAEETAVAETTVQKPEGATETAAPTTETAAPAKVEIDYKALAEAMVAAQSAIDEAKAERDTKTEATKAETAETKQQDAKETAETTDTAPADKAQLREGLKDVVRELLTETDGVRPTRKGYGLAETTEAGPDTDELWDKRGQLFVAAAREAQQLGLGNRD